MRTKHRSYKILNLFLIFVLVINVSSLATADVAASLVFPTAPTAPTAPSAPSAPSAPTAPTAPSAPSAPSVPTSPTPPTQAPSAPSAPKQPKQYTQNPTPTPTESQSQPQAPSQPQQPAPATPLQEQTSSQGTTSSPTQYSDTTGKQDGGYGVGDAAIATGNADVTANLSTQANTNAYTSLPKTSDVTTEMYKNGADSTNVIDYSGSTLEEVYQQNNLLLYNDMNVEANSGDNTIAKNTGGSNTITTGDATAQVNVFNFGNANFANVAVAEFDAYDTTAGDIYLDTLSYAPAQSLIANTNGNGAGSSNTTQVGTGSTVLIFQDNFAEVTNDVDIEVNTGDNEITKSMGDSSITTGDANVFANIVNFLNTNFVGLGNLLVGVVNIFDGYQGDVYLPDTNNLALTNPNTSITLENNGAGSANGVTVTDEELMFLTQNNTAVINNTVNIDAVTGENDASKNTGGNIAVKTGNVDSHVSTTTVAGQNFIANDSTINLVFVNKDGVITPYYVDLAGNLMPVPQVYAGIGGNGAYSENIIATSDVDVVDITQNNTAVVNNNLNIKANTGGNTVDKNTGGNIAIETGDVSVLASITNFVGNNFIGNNLVVTFVNALGDWAGSVLPSWAQPKTENDISEQDVLADTTQDTKPAAQKQTTSQEVADQDASQPNESAQENNDLSATGHETPASGDSSDKPALARFSVSGVLGMVGLTSGDDGSEDGQGQEGVLAGGVSNTIPVYHPTIDTSSAAKAAIDFSQINPLKLIAVAGLILVVNSELKKKLLPFLSA